MADSHTNATIASIASGVETRGGRIEDAPIENDPVPHLVNGYPKTAGYIESVPEAGIFRAFDALNIRKLLYLQAELTELELMLQEVESDDRRSEGEHRKYYSVYWPSLERSERSSDPAERKQWQLLTQRIFPKLREYNKLLLQRKEVASMPFPREYDLKLIQNIWDAQGFPLRGPDRKIWGSVNEPDKHAPDLIALRSRKQDDAFSRWIAERGSKIILKYFHRSMHQSQSTGLKGIKDDTLLRLATAVTTVIASTMPSLTITVLYFIKSTPLRLGVLAIFNVLIAVCLTAFTAARRLDIFAVSAAFAAVQVVFIGTNH